MVSKAKPPLTPNSGTYETRKPKCLATRAKPKPPLTPNSGTYETRKPKR
jgi:hypothetical protein